MKITLISHEIPYPPNVGARIDIWRRIKAFSAVGVELQLVSWYHNAPNPEDVVQMKQYVTELCLIQFKRTPDAIFQRVIDLFSYPLEVTSRIVRGKELSRLVQDVSVFQPDIVWLDGIHGGEIATELSKHLNIPLVTRSHNIEHLYYRRLLASTIDFRSKLRRYLSVSHLENYEKSLLRNSALFYDISIDDLKFWQDQGFTNGRYLPPLVEFSQDSNVETVERNKSEKPKYDVVFLGNLRINNNVAGIFWFINKVFPLIRAKLPTVKVLIAGSNPVDKLRKLCEENEGVDLLINPASSAAVYDSGRVLMNPVLIGSGVSIKSIEMLNAGRPIVSTPQGIAGLPEEVRKYFRIAVDAESFAVEILKLLSTTPEFSVDRALLESFFGTQVIQAVVDEMKSLP